MIIIRGARSLFQGRGAGGGGLWKIGKVGALATAELDLLYDGDLLRSVCTRDSGNDRSLKQRIAFGTVKKFPRLRRSVLKSDEITIGPEREEAPARGAFNDIRFPRW